ncbi:MAG TPA: UPF0149 family protein [Burkholderiales bacterium]|nr:UPF0149 family protein [Burkholderiales bacterium]
MATIPILPDYDELEDELRALDAVNAAEAHGVIAGITSAVSARADAGIGIVLADVDAAANSLSARRLLESVGNYTETHLAARDSEFELLLPDEAEPLDARTGALADFCRGYVLGLVAGGVRELAALPGDAREVVEDFMKISNVQADNMAETEEQALAELTEYVRTGVQVVYEELHPGN